MVGSLNNRVSPPHPLIVFVTLFCDLPANGAQDEKFSMHPIMYLKYPYYYNVDDYFLKKYL